MAQVTIRDLEGILGAVIPGMTFVSPGEDVTFDNQTKHVAEIRLAEEDVLDCVQPLKIEPGASQTCRVTAPAVKVERIVEYVVLVTLSSGKTVFAVGASTPKIIIRSSSSRD